MLRVLIPARQRWPLKREAHGAAHLPAAIPYKNCCAGKSTGVSEREEDKGFDNSWPSAARGEFSFPFRDNELGLSQNDISQLVALLREEAAGRRGAVLKSPF